MQIGQIIRDNRKKKHMTQEEMACRLGVTAPAVNKWENGNSLPDITLLAPIARLLGVTLEELLSFREELTEQEIHHLLEELADRGKEESFEETFSWAQGIMREYPNCDKLIWQMTAYLDAKRLFDEVPGSDTYDAYLLDCYERLLMSREPEVKRGAADALFTYYLRKEQYDKAEEYLAYCSDENPDKKRKRAVICSRTGRISEAYRLYEEIVFADWQIMSLVFHGIYSLAIQEGDMEKARMIAEKQGELGQILDMGTYYQYMARLELAVAEQNAKEAAAAAGKMLEQVGSLYEFAKSRLYEHMTFQEVTPAIIDEVRRRLLDGFRDGKEYLFLKDQPEWQAFMDSQTAADSTRID